MNRTTYHYQKQSFNIVVARLTASCYQKIYLVCLDKTAKGICSMSCSHFFLFAAYDPFECETLALRCAPKPFLLHIFWCYNSSSTVVLFVPVLFTKTISSCLEKLYAFYNSAVRSSLFCYDIIGSFFSLFPEATKHSAAVSAGIRRCFLMKRWTICARRWTKRWC